MKITESKLRKMIRTVIVELTSSARAGGRTKMKKGERSAAFKSADSAFKSADTAYKSAEKAYSSAETAFKGAQDSVKSAQKTLDSAKADLDKHIKNEPTKLGDKSYTYTNTVTGQKVKVSSDPGKVGSYTIPAVGGAELKPTTTHFFSEVEIKSKATKVKGPKQLKIQIQSDLDKWIKFEKDAIGTLPKGFTSVITNMKAANAALDNLKLGQGFEYYSPGSPKTFQAAKAAPEQGKGGIIKAGEAGKEEKKFGTEKQYQSDVQDYEKKAGLEAKKVPFTLAKVTEEQPITAKWTSWNNTKTTKTNAKNTAQSTLDTAKETETTRKSEFDTKSSERETKAKERSKKDALRKQKEKEDIKKQNTAAEPTADEPKAQPTGGGAGGATGGKGKGKGRGKGKGKGKKGKKDESLFRILGRDTLNEIKEIKRYNSYLRQPRNRRRK